MNRFTLIHCAFLIIISCPLWESLDPTGIASIVKAYNHPVCAAPSVSQ